MKFPSKILITATWLTWAGHLYADPAASQAQLTLNDLRTFTDVFNQLRSNFVEEVDDATLLNAPIRGMITELDTHSVFLEPAAFRQLDDFSYFTGMELPRSMLVLDGSRGVSLLFVPPRDARFENPGRRNDFPGRPLGDDPSLLDMVGEDDDIGVVSVALDVDVAEMVLVDTHGSISLGDPAGENPTG